MDATPHDELGEGRSEWVGWTRIRPPKGSPAIDRGMGKRICDEWFFCCITKVVRDVWFVCDLSDGMPQLTGTSFFWTLSLSCIVFDLTVLTSRARFVYTPYSAGRSNREIIHLAQRTDCRKADPGP